MKIVKPATSLAITIMVLTSYGTMAQEAGTAPAPSPSMESAGMMLQVPTLVAGIVSLVACFF
ncbi:hypothetical protein R6Q57_013703 [Mikania cordata]